MLYKGINEILRVELAKNQNEKLHSNKDIEIIYILHGEISVAIAESTIKLSPKDYFIIDKGQLHEIESYEDAMYVKIYVLSQAFSHEFRQGNILLQKSINPHDKTFEIAIQKLLLAYIDKSNNSVDYNYLAKCYDLLNILQNDFMEQRSSISEVSNEKFDCRIDEINAYMWNNYQQQISLKELSENLYLSIGHLSRFFKEHYKMSFTENLMRIRLIHTIDDLIYTNKPITQIAYDNGFPSSIALNRAFKAQYNQTPSEYRQKHGNLTNLQATCEKPTFLLQQFKETLASQVICQAQQSTTTLTPITKVYTYSSTQTQELFPLWQDLINIGSAQELLRADVCAHVLMLRTITKCKYVRFWNLLSRELILNEQDDTTDYYFLKIDRIIDFLLTNDLLPHIELGIKPQRIQKNPFTSIVYKADDFYVQNTNSWNSCFDQLLNHWLQRYSHNEIKKWRFEISFDEEQETPSTFLKHLNDTKSLLQKHYIFSPLGAGISSSNFDENYNNDFWAMLLDEPVKPDFITFMHYAYKVSSKSDEPHHIEYSGKIDLREKILRLQERLNSAQITNTQLYLTELGSSVSDRNFINDSCFSAAYFFQNVFSSYGYVQGIGFCLGSDLVSSYYDTKTLLFGGRGMINCDGIIKPSGFAFTFLNRLYPYYIGHDNTHIITTDRHSRFSVIAHNQKDLNYHYYFTDESMIGKESLNQYFVDTQSLNIKIHIQDIPNLTYKIKSYSIAENTNSILNYWQKLDYEHDISRNDIQYLQRLNGPELSIHKKEAINNALDFTYTLSANEIVLLDITPT